ncbi:MAG: response regulator [Desulfuromonadaceae bacterium]
MEKAHQGIDQLHPHVLVVDDELDMCCMVANYLKRIGCKVDMACNAADAYSMVEDGQYQAILSDIKMPGEDGISLLVRIRKICPDTPVILMSDQNDTQLAVAAIKHGAFDSVQKPLDFILLEKIVERAVNHDRLLRLEKNYLTELEQKVTEQTLESEAGAAQLRVKLAERQAAEEKLEQARSAVEAANEKLQKELAEQKAVGEQLGQARIAAEAANEQLRAEYAERQQEESRLQQAAAERTSELQTVIEQLLAELAERTDAEEKLKQARAAAEVANEQLQADLTTELKKYEEQLEQAGIAAEAVNEQLRSELAERTAAGEQLEQARAATEAVNEQLQAELAAERRQAETVVAQFQTEIAERHQMASSLQQTAAERTLELQTVMEQLQAELAAAYIATGEQLEQARVAAEADNERLQTELAAAHKAAGEQLEQTRITAEAANERLLAELAAERQAGEERLEQEREAAEAAVEQMQAKHAERKREWQNVTEQLQIEFSERQAAEELLKQAQEATEAVNKQLQAEIAERQQSEISLQEAAEERALALQAVIEQLEAEVAAEHRSGEEQLEQARLASEAVIEKMQAKHAERKREWQTVTEQLQIEFTERQAAEEQLKQARESIEAVNEQLRAEIAGRQQSEISLQEAAEERTLALQAAIEQLEAERAAERQSTEEQLEQARLDTEAAREQMQAKLAERKQELQTVADQLQIEFAERQAAEEQLEQARIAAESLNEQLHAEIARYLHVEQALNESEYKHRGIIQSDMDGFWLMGRAGHLLEVNNAYCHMSGYSEQELLALHVNDLEVFDPAADPTTHIQSLITDGIERFEVQQRRKDGSVFDVEIHAQHPADEDGHIVVFLQDITDRKRLAESLRTCESLEQAVTGRTQELASITERLEAERSERNQVEFRLETTATERTREFEAVVEQLKRELAEHTRSEESLQQYRLVAEADIEQLQSELAAERSQLESVTGQLQAELVGRRESEERLEQAWLAAEAAAEQFQAELVELREVENNLEQAVAERTQELERITEQLQVECAERQQVESNQEQARLSSEATIEQLQSERGAERRDAEERLEQARLAAEAAAEQFQAELTERRQAESSLEQAVAERTQDLTSVTEQLEAERARYKQAEESLEQAKLAAAAVIEQFQAELAERRQAENRLEQAVAERTQELASVTEQLEVECARHRQAEESLEQAKVAAEAVIGQLQSEIAGRTESEERLEEAWLAAEAAAEQFQAELATERTQLESVYGQLQAERDERNQVEFRLETTASERAREIEAVVGQLQDERAERKQAESSLKQAITERTQELERVTEQLQAERAERQQVESNLEQARLSSEAAIEQLQSERDTGRRDAEERLEQARLAAEAAAEQFQSERDERREVEANLEQTVAGRTQELERVTEQLQAERAERQQVESNLEQARLSSEAAIEQLQSERDTGRRDAEERLEQARLAAEAAAEQFQSERDERREVEANLEQTVAERTQELERVTEQLQAERDERNQVEFRLETTATERAREFEAVVGQLQDERAERNQAESNLEQARMAAEAAAEQFQAELAGRRQAESRLELTVAGLTHELESVVEQFQAERAERQQRESNQEQARAAAETVIGTLQAELAARREELAAANELLQSELAERKEAEERVLQLRLAAAAVAEKLQGELAVERIQAEALNGRLQAEIADRQQVESGLEQTVAELTGELESVSEQLQAEYDEHLHAKQLLTESEYMHRSLIQTGMDGFWLMGRAGHLLEVNNAYCQMSGYSEQELLAMHVNELEASDPTTGIATHIQNLITDGDDRFESQHRRKDGSVFDIEIHAQIPADEDGHIAIFLRDITDRKRLEEALRTCENLEQTVAQRTVELEETTELLRSEHSKRVQVKNILEQRIAERTQELEKSAELLQAADAERTEAEEKLEQANIVTEAAKREVEAVNAKLQAEHDKRQRVENNLEQVKEFSDRLFNSPLDTVYLFDPATGEPVRWNRRFAEVCGYSDQEIAQMKAPDDFYDEASPHSAKEALVTVASGKKGVAELTLLTKSGMRIPYEYGVTAIQTADGRSLLMPIGRDITGRKTKSAILANMSREIRTETNGIINMNAFLLDSNLSKEQRHFAEIAYKSGESLLEYISDIVDFSNIEAGILEIEKQDFDLKALLENTAEVLAAKAADTGLELSCRIDPKVPLKLKGDPKRIREIIANIAGNAIEFTRKGKIFISAGVESDLGDSVMIRISVKDSGTGKPDERQIALYDPFVLLEGATTRNYGDASLGLAMCKLLVELMGGKIGVDSVEGKGTTFWFTAQLEKQVSVALPQSGGHIKVPEVSGKAVARPAMSDSAKRGIRILLAEDYLTNQQVALIILNKLGYQADAVLNGVEAVSALEHTNYDLVLMDCEMPKMNGFEATAVIRSKSSKVFNHSVPIIALTANAFDQDREKCLEAGMNDYLTKPVRMEKLAVALDKWLLPGAPLLQGTLPLFEEKELLEYLDGDLKYTKKILNYVMKTFPDHVETLKNLAKGTDTEAICLHANTMTGLVSCTFTPALQEICVKVETAAQEGDLGATRELLPEMEQIALKTLDKIRTAATRISS